MHASPLRRGRTQLAAASIIVGMALLCAPASGRGDAVVGAAVPAQAKPGAIEGVAIDSDGKPVEGALVAAVPENAGNDDEDTRAAALARTRRDGRFRLSPLPPGSYGVTATRSGLAAAFEGRRVVASGKTVRGVKLRMGKPAGAFRGLVQDVRGRPIPGAQVRVIRYSDDLGDVFYADVDSAGRYEIHLPEGTYLLVVVAEGYASESRRRTAEGDLTVDVALTRAAPPGPAPEGVVDWIRANAIPLRTVEAGHGFSDMEPLRAVIGDARVVTLGEATHGTREFFQLKHRMLEYLVSEMGFTLFGIEATMPEGFDVNEYVLTGRGDPEKALSGLYFWVWDTEEVLDLIRWMRRWNADPTHRNKVKFYGFDMQFSPHAVKAVIDFLRQVDPDEAARQAEALTPIRDPFRARRYRRLPESQRAAIESSVALLRRRLDERRPDYERRSSPRAWELARQHARILGQWVTLAGPDGPRARDRAMADNIVWILGHEGPAAKMVVWAHNGHVSMADPDGGGGSNGMGFDLRRALGPGMVVFGFAFGRGSFQAIDQASGDLRSFTVGPAPEGTLDDTLERAGLRVAAIDLRPIPASGTVGDWFFAKHPTRDTGAAFSDSLADRFFTSVVVPHQYDALLFVDSTTAARGNPRSRRTAVATQPAPVNLDFEEGTEGKAPPGWVGPSGLAADYFRAELTRNEPRSGRRCVRIQSTGSRTYGEWYGGLSQTIAAKPYQGKRVRVRAFLRVRPESGDAGAHFWLRGMGSAATIWGERFYESTEERPIAGDVWRESSLEALVPDDLVTLDYGFALVGKGTAWIDAVSVEAVDR